MRARVQHSNAIPFFGLVTFWFAMEYLRPQDYITFLGYIRPGLITLIIISMVWLLRGEKSALKDKLVIAYAIFIVLGVLSLLYANNTYWAARRNLELISFLVGGVLPFVAFMDRPEALRRFFNWWVFIHALVAVAGVLRGGTGSGGFMGDENDLALTMAMAMPFAYFLATQEQNAVRKVLLIIAGLLMVAAIVATRSRGGFLGMMTATFAIVYFSRNRVRNFVAVSVIAGLAVLVLVQARLTAPMPGDPNDPTSRQQQGPSYWDEMSSIRDATDSTRLSRFYFWGRSWEMFVDNPVLGVGTSNFGWVVEDYERRDPAFVGDVRWSGGRVNHSIYFTVLAEYGLAGTLVFAFITAGIIHRLRKARRLLSTVETDEARVMTALVRAGSAGLMAYLIAGAFLTVNYYPHLWYLLGFTIAMHRIAQKLAPQEVTHPRTTRARLRASPSQA